jgi:hypothetical protein
MNPPWIAGYRDPVPIRCRSGLHFYSCRDRSNGRLQVVVMAPYLPVEEARARLSGLARVHRLVAGPNLPGVAAASLDGPAPWVALDCDAVADLEVLTDFVLHGADKPTYELTSTISKTLMETLARCHRVRDPESGRAICLGSISAANLFFSAEGQISILGFGAGPLAGAFVAPEVAAGDLPTPSGDLYALTVFVRSQIGFTKLPPILRRVFNGKSIGNDARLLMLLAWSNLKILAGPPAKRPKMEQALGHAREMWNVLGFEPDVEGFARWVADAIAADPQPLARVAQLPTQTPGILLGEDGAWMQTPNGMRHALGRRRSLRRLMLELARAHAVRSGEALTIDALLEAGWPGERPLAEAGNNRVWVAISTLRKIGLGEALQRWDGGYRLDPTVPCRIESA